MSSPKRPTPHSTQRPTHRRGASPLTAEDIDRLLEDDTVRLANQEADFALVGGSGFAAVPLVVDTRAARVPVDGERAVSPLSDEDIEILSGLNEVTSVADPVAVAEYHTASRSFLAGGIISSSNPQDLDLIARPVTPSLMPRHVLDDYEEDFFSAVESSASAVAAPAPTRRVQLSEVPVQPLCLIARGRKMMKNEEIYSEENKKSGIAFGERAEAIFAQRKGNPGAVRGGK